jgi:extracellular factor (EF) 3-hydroxypalmitic acid methyl ester biosynthesis protein
MNTIDSLSAQAIPSERLSFIYDLIGRHGPEPQEYAAFTAWVDALADDVKAGRMTEEAVFKFWQDLTKAYFRGSLQGLVVEIPHGYHGDFEVIDGIHCEKISSNPALARWDGYLQAQAAPKAVRNRKTYFHGLLNSIRNRETKPLKILNVASGPSRDVREWLDAHGPCGMEFDCVDLDGNAIEFAKDLCKKYHESVDFFHHNALTFRPRRDYDLVWSAGLFDYLEDRLFIRLLRRLITFTAAGGEVVIGNFGEDNPTRNYMELLGRWRLIHRSEQHLHSLAEQAGAKRENIQVGKEPEGVNLFLHIKAQSDANHD